MIGSSIAGARAQAVPGGQQAGAIAEIDILWITAGLGCDGDTIAMTAATQPSIEDEGAWRPAS